MRWCLPPPSYRTLSVWRTARDSFLAEPLVLACGVAVALLGAYAAFLVACNRLHLPLASPKAAGSICLGAALGMWWGCTLAYCAVHGASTGLFAAPGFEVLVYVTVVNEVRAGRGWGSAASLSSFFY